MIIVGMLFIAAALAVMQKENIENYVGVSIIVSTIIEFSFIKVGFAEVGVWVVLGLVILAIIYLAYNSYSYSFLIKQYVVTPGLFAFLLLSFAIVIFNGGIDASGGPDAVYWVRIVKSLYYYNSFEKSPVGLSHPQFIAVWGYLSMKTWTCWSDYVLIVSHSIAKMSMLIPLFGFVRSEKKVNYHYCGLITLTIFAIPYLSDCNEYSTYAPDMLMGILLGMGMVFFVAGIEDGKTNMLWCSLCYFCAAVITKRVVIALLAFLYFWMLYVLFKEKKRKGVLLFTILPMLSYWGMFRVDKYPLVLLAAVLVGYGINWVISRGSKRAFAISIISVGVVALITVGVLINYYIRDTRVDFFVVAPLYFKLLFTAREEWFYLGELFKLPIGEFVLINFFVFCLILIKKREFFGYYEKVMFLGINVFIGLYFFMFFHLYNTQISANSFSFQDDFLGIPRYFKIIPVMYFIFWLFILISKEKRPNSIGVLLIVVLLLANLKAVGRFIAITPNREAFTEFAEAGIELTDKESIAYIGMGENSPHKSFRIRFYPSLVIDIDKLSRTYRITNDMKYMQPEELSKQIEDCDYVYINDADEQFSTIYAGLFADPDSIDTDKSIYYHDENGLLRQIELK